MRAVSWAVSYLTLVMSLASEMVVAGEGKV